MPEPVDQGERSVPATAPSDGDEKLTHRLRRLTWLTWGCLGALGLAVVVHLVGVAIDTDYFKSQGASVVLSVLVLLALLCWAVGTPLFGVLALRCSSRLPERRGRQSPLVALGVWAALVVLAAVAAVG